MKKHVLLWRNSAYKSQPGAYVNNAKSTAKYVNRYDRQAGERPTGWAGKNWRNRIPVLPAKPTSPQAQRPPGRRNAHGVGR